MKCCLAHVLPTGTWSRSGTYNTLYRDGHVPLPPLADRPPAPARRSAAGRRCPASPSGWRTESPPHPRVGR